jgi:disulfide bond formation protein DsbB
MNNLEQNITTPNNSIFFDLITILGISIVSLFAIVVQLISHDIPCPLCLLQRVGILAIALPYILNIMNYRHRFHYLISIIAALLTMMPSIRQVFLHITPDSGSYGDTLLGLHLYTWVVILCISIILWSSILMTFCTNQPNYKKIGIFEKIILSIYFLIILFNIASTFLECGFTQCPADPTVYQMLQH